MTTTSLLFYQRIVTLDPKLHANLKLRTSADLAFADDAPVVPLETIEFNDAAREYPIVFLRNGEKSLCPAVLTGPAKGQNVYIDDKGRWNARYVPTYARHYPFVFAQTAPQQFAVCIDEACPGFNDVEGIPLFGSTGKPTPMLEEVISQLGEYGRQEQITQQFMQRLAAADLLMKAGATTDLQDGRSLALRGFWIINEARFRALPEATVRAFFASGDLGLIYAHLLSLGNLVELLRRQDVATEKSETAGVKAPATIPPISPGIVGNR
jgi:SapC